MPARQRQTLQYFYPRSPCGERRGCSRRQRCGGKFLSTLSLRRATSLICRISYLRHNFYPRSPCGERPLFRDGKEVLLYFYPRSPCGERRNGWQKASSKVLFLSTLSLRRATPIKWVCVTENQISIHALLAESDESL